jgi:hypothetical protein
MDKGQILDALEDEREKFLEAIEDLSDEALQEPGVVGEWSVKDILCHLSAWEAELVKLLWQAKQGQNPSTVHFAGIPVDEINARWYEAYHSRILEDALSDLEGVRKQTLRRVEKFSDEALNDAQRYPWLQGYPLWEWIANDSFKHEAEHTAQIVEWRARRGI